MDHFTFKPAVVAVTGGLELLHVHVCYSTGLFAARMAACHLKSHTWAALHSRMHSPSSLLQ